MCLLLQKMDHQNEKDSSCEESDYDDDDDNDTDVIGKGQTAMTGLLLLHRTQIYLKKKTCQLKLILNNIARKVLRNLITSSYKDSASTDMDDDVLPQGWKKMICRELFLLAIFPFDVESGEVKQTVLGIREVLSFVPVLHQAHQADLDGTGFLLKFKTADGANCYSFSC
ncbi:LOW QUALITY PROTEIN: hypothetical protein NC651_023303 [Populus alba x Populus x berolinensis]|nr:LOW QUALITY PROTEIN: hypothetical protein NC651_023303 [Populus alba x Populus x berolinensis]